MTPVYQKILIHWPELGRFGDCMRASVASVLDLPLEAVPHFADPTQFADHDRALVEFLRPFGLSIVMNRIPADAYETICDELERQGMDAYHLIGGVARGSPHMCVARCGRVVHDPWPLGTAPLDPDPEIDGYDFTYIVRGGW